jgi:hypothetical protein
MGSRDQLLERPRAKDMDQIRSHDARSDEPFLHGKKLLHFDF